MEVEISELMAAGDIARTLSVCVSAVSNWQKRDLNFPEPVGAVSNGNIRLWRRSDVLRWYATRNEGNLDHLIERHRAIVAALEETRA